VFAFAVIKDTHRNYFRTRGNRRVGIEVYQESTSRKKLRIELLTLNRINSPVKDQVSRLKSHVN